MIIVSTTYTATKASNGKMFLYRAKVEWWREESYCFVLRQYVASVYGRDKVGRGVRTLGRWIYVLLAWQSRAAAGTCTRDSRSVGWPGRGRGSTRAGRSLTWSVSDPPAPLTVTTE